jgi:hypothetical protein
MHERKITMTLEEMEKVREMVAVGLRSAGFENVTVIDFEPGEPLPIGASKDDDDFVITVDVA